MSDDHAASLATMVAAFLPVEGDVTRVTMTSCDRDGFEVRLTLAPTEPDAADGLAFGRLGFPEPLSDPGQARHALVELVHAAGAGSPP